MPNAFSPLARNLKPKKKGRNFRPCKKNQTTRPGGQTSTGKLRFSSPACYRCGGEHSLVYPTAWLGKLQFSSLACYRCGGEHPLAYPAAWPGKLRFSSLACYRCGGEHPLSLPCRMAGQTSIFAPPMPLFLVLTRARITDCLYCASEETAIPLRQAEGEH